MHVVSCLNVVLPPLSLLICLSVTAVQICAVFCFWKKYASTIDTIFVILCVLVCFTTNTIMSTLGILMSTALPSCNVCSWAPLVVQILYTTRELSVYLFYLQRARLAQSFNPQIPLYCFTKLFPAFFLTVWISMSFLFILREPDQSECNISNQGEGRGGGGGSSCFIITPSNGRYLNVGGGLDLFVSLFFGYLFVRPLLRLIVSNEKQLRLERDSKMGIPSTLSIMESMKTRSFSTPSTRPLMSARYAIGTPSTTLLPVMSHSQPSYRSIVSPDHRHSLSPRIDRMDTRFIQTQELKRALWYNVTLSLLSLTASILTMIIWPLSPQKLFWIPYCDYITNSMTTFLMLGRNRKYLNRTMGRCITSMIGQFGRKRMQDQHAKHAVYTLSIQTMSTGNVATLKEDCNASSGESVLSTTSELLGSHLDVPHYLATPQRKGNEMK